MPLSYGIVAVKLLVKCKVCMTRAHFKQVGVRQCGWKWPRAARPDTHGFLARRHPWGVADSDCPWVGKA
jgi:hypothetical protein